MNILRMINPIQPYAWGSKQFIQELTGDIAAKGYPQAELWMGAHPKSSSQILNGDIEVNLHYILAEDPTDFLGSRIARSYNDQLPFLLKILAAEHSLSVQVHPNAKQARDGFLREEKIGIAIDSPQRNYKDSFHKPELIVALTEFHALCGFRPVDELTHLLKKYLTNSKFPELAAFYEQPDSANLAKLYTAMLRANQESKSELIDTFIKHIHSNLPANPQEQYITEWSVQLAKDYPGDIGILSPLLLNIVVLKPLEGLFLPSGMLHSYLKGAAVEIMANSDNVLRGGLTPKYVDSDELLRVVDFNSSQPAPLIAEALNAVEHEYLTPAVEFVLSLIQHKQDMRTDFQPSSSPEIIFCYEGSFVVENCSQFLPLEKGQSLFVPYEVEGFSIQGKGTIFRAKCPV